jgi:transcriptional regulator with XRE-family HTH domain
VDRTEHDAANRRLADLLRTYRERAGLRQADVAAALDVHQSFVSKYESSERRLDLVELEAVARAVGVSLRTVVDDFARR